MDKIGPNTAYEGSLVARNTVYIRNYKQENKQTRFQIKSRLFKSLPFFNQWAWWRHSRKCLRKFLPSCGPSLMIQPEVFDAITPIPHLWVIFTEMTKSTLGFEVVNEVQIYFITRKFWDEIWVLQLISRSETTALWSGLCECTEIDQCF